MTAYGTPTPTLTTTVTCPVCAATMTWVNGTHARSQKGIGTEALALLRCADHGEWEVRTTLRRALVPRHRPSGHQQRQTRQGRPGSPQQPARGLEPLPLP